MQALTESELIGHCLVVEIMSWAWGRGLESISTSMEQLPFPVWIPALDLTVFSLDCFLI